MLDDGPHRDGGGACPPSRDPFRSVLWVVLVLSAAANLVVSSVGVASGANLVCGLITAGCAVVLVALWRRERRA